jgi:hypothetical protein
MGHQASIVGNKRQESIARSSNFISTVRRWMINEAWTPLMRAGGAWEHETSWRKQLPASDPNININQMPRLHNQQLLA